MEQKLKGLKKGFTLTEVMLCLAIAAIIIITIFMAYPKIKASQYIDQESRNIASIKAGVRSLYTTKPSYSGLSNKVAAYAEIIPSSMIQSNTSYSLKSAWGGTVTIYSSDYGITKSPDSSFTIIYTNVPADVCAKLVATDAGEMSAIKVGNTRVKEIGGLLDIDATTTACAPGNININFSSL